MIIKDLQAVDNPSALATRIAASGSYLVYITCSLMIVFSLALLLVLVLLILWSNERHA